MFDGIRKLLGYFCFYPVIFLHASDTDPKLKIRLHGGIPRNVSSRLFNYSFNGEICGNMQFSFFLFHGFYGGISYNFTQFVNAQEFRDPKAARLYVRLHSHAASVRVTFERSVSKKATWVCGLQGGISYQNYTGRTFALRDTLIPRSDFITPFLMPEVAIEWKVEEHLAFSSSLGWQCLFSHFDARQSSLDRFYNTKSLEKFNRNAFPISWINFSFGCTVYLGKHH